MLFIQVVSPPSDGYFDVPRVVERDQSFLDIVAHPRVTSVLDKVIGPDLQLLNIQCRNYPAQSAKKAAESGARPVSPLIRRRSPPATP